MSKIPFKSLKIVTFTAGRQTQARRTEPIRQLQIPLWMFDEADG